MATVRVPKKIRECAEKAREWAEEVSAPGGAYDHVDDTLAGLCAIATVYLGSLLEQAGYQPIYALRCSDHCFIVCNGLVVDVTATQFNRKPIEIIPVLEARKHCDQWGDVIWSIDTSFESPHRLVRRLKKDKWPEEQVPKIKEIVK